MSIIRPVLHLSFSFFFANYRKQKKKCSFWNLIFFLLLLPKSNWKVAIFLQNIIIYLWISLFFSHFFSFILFTQFRFCAGYRFITNDVIELLTVCLYIYTLSFWLSGKRLFYSSLLNTPKFTHFFFFLTLKR